MNQGLKSVNKYDMIAPNNLKIKQWCQNMVAYSNFNYLLGFIPLERPDSDIKHCKPLKSFITADYTNKTENKIQKS